MVDNPNLMKKFENAKSDLLHKLISSLPPEESNSII